MRTVCSGQSWFACAESMQKVQFLMVDVAVLRNADHHLCSAASKKKLDTPFYKNDTSLYNSL